MKKFYSNTSAIFLFIIFIIAMGIMLFQSIPIDLYPMTSKPIISVNITPIGVSAEEFKDRYGKDIESSLLSVRDVDLVEGKYNYSNVVYSVKFGWGIDPDDAKSDVKAAMESYGADFPDEWPSIKYGRGEDDNGRMLGATVKSDKIDSVELHKLLDQSLKPELERIDGCLKVKIADIEPKRILITLNQNKLNTYGLKISQIKDLLRRKKYNTSLGLLDLNIAGQFRVRGMTKNENLDDLRKSVIGYSGGKSIKLSDVAKVTVEEIDDMGRDIQKGNGELQVFVAAYPKPETNIRKFAREYQEVLDRKTKEIDPDIKYQVLLNPATFINEAVSNILFAVFVGMGIATIIVLLFLGSFRNTIIVAVSIPLSLIAGFILLHFFGIGINLVSLGAMALAVGMVVDGAIVVLENIIRHMEVEKISDVNSRLDVIIKATKEVRMPVITSLLTTIIVFVPLPFTSPLTNAILGDLAIVMVSVLVVSIAVSLFVIPSMVYYFKIDKYIGRKKGISSLVSRKFNWLFEIVTSLYLKLVRLFLRRKSISFSFLAIIVGVFTVSSWVLVTKIDREVIIEPKTKWVYAYFHFYERYTLDQAHNIISKQEELLKEKFKNDITWFYTRIRNGNGLIAAALKNKEEMDIIEKRFEDTFVDSPMARVFVGHWSPTSLEIPDPPVVEVSVNALVEEEKREILAKIADVVRNINEVGERRSEPDVFKSDFYEIEIDDFRFEQLRYSDDPKVRALTRQDIYDLVRGYITKTEIMELKYDNVDIPVVITFSQDEINTPGEIGNLLISVGEKVVPIKALVKLKKRRDYTQYMTEDSRSLGRIKVWAKDSFQGSRKELQKKIKGAILSANDIDKSMLSFADTDEEINDNLLSLIMALLFALALIFILITFQFRIISRTLIIMVAIPVGMIGATFSLWVFSSTLCVNSMLGLILLCGTAVNNSIIFVDFFLNAYKKSNKSIDEIILETAKVRFRPIMITTLTTICGMIPIALGLGKGGEVMQPLGIAICGGLGISTLLTVFVVPILLKFFQRKPQLNVGVFTKPVLATIFLAGIFSTLLISSNADASKVMTLSLDEAKKIALKNHLDIKRLTIGRKKSKYDRKKTVSELLPRVSVERRMESKKVDDQKRNEQTYNVFRIEQSINQPYAWYLKHKSAILGEKMADLTLDEKRFLIEIAVNSLYLKAKIAEKSLENASRNLLLSEENLRTGQKRYQKGYINDSELRRIRLENRARASVRRRSKFTYRNELINLLNVLQIDLGANVKLSDDLKSEFNFMKSKNSLRQVLSTNSISYEVRKKSKKLEINKVQYKIAEADLYPEINIAVQYTDYDDQSPENQRMSNKYVAFGIKWEILSGLSDYYSYKAKRAEVQISRFELERMKLDRNAKKRQILESIETLWEEIIIEKNNLKDLDSISNTSKKRFEKGLIDFKSYNDDFIKYIEKQNHILSLYGHMVAEIEKLCIFMGTIDIFNKLY